MQTDVTLDDEILLPQTEEEFDKLTGTIAQLFNIGDKTLVAAVLANQIQRLPPEQAYSTIKALGEPVLKSIAYSVALSKSRKLDHRMQIDNLASLLKANPHDQQALDALDAASKEGSEYAAEILSLYRPEDAGDNVIKINPHITDETKGSAV